MLAKRGGAGRPRAPRLRGRVRDAHLHVTRLRARARRGVRAYDGGGPAQPRPEHHAYREHDPRGMGPSMAVVGSTTKKAVFEASTPSGSWRPRSAGAGGRLGQPRRA